MPELLKRVMKQVVHRLLKVSSLRFAVLFLIVAVLVSVMIVLTIDFLWDGRFNAELEFAGVVTPFLDGLFLVVFVTAMLDAIREEAGRRKQAEAEIRKLNEELEKKVQERTQQLIEAQDELVRRERLALLGQVADSVGHELRNPLGVMSNAVYFLKAVMPDADQTTREYLDIIESEIAEAGRIVSDLLDAVRTKPPRAATVDVAELIDETLHKCDVPSGIAVKLDIADGLAPIQVDPMQMYQVFWNLITNGVEAMPGGGTLEIRVAEDKPAHTLRISVRDSGTGITPEHQARLFQPLFTTKSRRVGLGLAVVKNLTQVNGGNVEAQSEPGKGTVFVVTLPSGG